MDSLVERLRDYGLTLDENVIICDRRAVDEAADRIEALEKRVAEEATRSMHAEARAALARRAALEEAAKVAEQMLVFADTTSDADKAIPAAIRSLSQKEG